MTGKQPRWIDKTHRGCLFFEQNILVYSSFARSKQRLHS
ncbi:hypothetical protein DCCM_0995 [Desulfocucumis palustris]|uniref:Uncharacterized protein n=1 Tax=Desulfocucumis palustris TaxID=1898651 RepID=A0A2L2X992_9FIRM|nr:hypothetical protein DCCM_0995 [Desulfocucumis palustris]